MKMRTSIAILFFLCVGWLVQAQNELYQGGIGDGFTFSSIEPTTINNTDLSVLYQGGIGDGFTFASIEPTTINNTDLSVLYQGGIGDGFTFASIEQTTIINTDLSVLYQGGIGDGFATIAADPIVLDDFPRIKLAIRVLLQGATFNPNTGEANLMRDDLRANSFLPTISPYNDGISSKTGVLNTGGPDGTGAINDNIVDWVFVELRNNTNTGIIEISKSALLQRDGDVVDIDGVSELTIPHTPGEYYITINHRNHLGVMTASASTLSQTVRIVNFSNNSFSVYGNYARINLGGGVMALWAGDANNDGVIKFSGSNNDANAIKDFVLADPLNILNFITFSSTGYLNSDLDLNDTSRFSGAPNDSNTIKDNILLHPNNILNLSTFSISEQLPNN